MDSSTKLQLHLQLADNDSKSNASSRSSSRSLFDSNHGTNATSRSLIDSNHSARGRTSSMDSSPTHSKTIVTNQDMKFFDIDNIGKFVVKQYK